MADVPQYIPGLDQNEKVQNLFWGSEWGFPQ
jgi:hypothetical protein